MASSRIRTGGVEKVAATSIGLPSQSRVFSLSEAEELFPLVERLTASACRSVEPLRKQLVKMVPADPRLPGLERSYAHKIERWRSDMERLGITVHGLWQIGFDTGEGYLAWRYPELRIGHFVDYGRAFGYRRPLENIIEERDPDWAHT